MKLKDARWLTDEDIQSGVVDYLRQYGLDTEEVSSLGMQGQKDSVVLASAFSSGRIVLTHDSDFGTLAIQRGEPFLGIVYLRPGHIDPSFSIASIQTLLQQDIDVVPTFIVVARRSQNQVSIRVRELGTPGTDSEDRP